MKNKEIISFLVLLSLVFLQPVYMQNEWIGEKAPDFKLERIGGGYIKLSALRRNIVLLDFWATWCGPCKMQLGALEEIYREEIPNLVILSINVAEPKSTVNDFLKRNPINWLVLLDTDGAVAEAYGVRAIPTLVLIDGEGVIRNYWVGVQEYSTILDAIEDIKQASTTSSSTETAEDKEVSGEILPYVVFAAILILVVILLVRSLLKGK